MRLSVDRFGAGALSAALVALLAAGPAPAGPVTSTSPSGPAAKIKEIEDAGLALQRGQFDEAFRLLQEAVKKDPNLPPARLMMGRLFLATREGQPQGRALVEQAAGENPDHPEVYLTLGSLALQDGRVTEALLDCQQALALTASDRWVADVKRRMQSQARTGLAAAYEARRDWAGMRTHVAALLELDPKNGQLRQKLARSLFFLDKPDDAYNELQEAVKNDALLEPASVGMGKLWTEKGDFKKAREWLDKAIKADPNSMRVHLAYAHWLLQQNEIDQARIHADTAARLKADDADVLKLQGLIARVQKNYPEAEKTFRRLLNDSPGDFFTSDQLALLLADQSDNEQRKKALQFAEVNARQYPRMAEALATLGYVHYRNGNLGTGFQYLQQAISGGQASADTAYYLALILSDQSKPEDARKLLEGGLKAKGLFVYRKEAQAMLDKLEKEKKETPKENKSKP
jgi:tetratricopeptide (TPR) repeat protein